MTYPAVRLDDAFERKQGRVYMTGMQALVRMALMQAESDAEAGLSTAGLISGYRGSPLGGFDTEVQRNLKRLQRANIVFQAGLNEDLAATAIMGAQQASAFGTARYAGVFGLWYGKGPGVDRSGDAFKHALRNGAAAKGGVLAVFGDDHPGKSSTVAHQSDPSLAAIGMPVLYPATLEELIAYGLYGWAASRASGLWVGLKCVNETAEATAVVRLDGLTRRFVAPEIDAPQGALHTRLAFDVAGDELRHIKYRLPAAEAFAKANPIDHVVFGAADAPLGVVTAGKSYLDVVDALRALGLAADGPVAVYKAGQIYPLERSGLLAFARGKRELVCIEEKTGLVEQQAASLLYNMPDRERPRLVGKQDDAGRAFAPRHGVLDARSVALLLGARLDAHGLAGEGVKARYEALRASAQNTQAPAAGGNRSPWFCSGCPHNTSTKAPDGSTTLTGIGCHTMAIWMDRDALPPAQMGGEGANWIGMAPFVETEHVFQNLGDGTYNHSGLLAIRAAVATNTRVTYKILFNDAVAMTGGQAHDGQLTVGDIVRQVLAERVARVVVVAEDPSRVSGLPLPLGVPIRHRDTLDEVQRDLRQHPGVTVLIYDQTCAAVLRRRRKRGQAETPARRVVINERVCEGCGDCSVQSNCTSIIPKPTELGLKRAIDQSSCNRDFSCVKGFCPSFVELEGAEVKTTTRDLDLSEALASLPEPRLSAQDEEIANILVAGIGGTGVVTVGALIGMAAHLEGADMAAYDMTGLAQKGGAVYSHIRVRAKQKERPFSPRLPPAGADVLIGCEAQVACAGDALTALRPGHTKAFLNEDVLAPGAFQLGAPVELETAAHQSVLESILNGPAPAAPATALAKALLGDSVYANVIMLGFAFQHGVLPASASAFERAIEINGASVQKNTQAFRIGRIIAHNPDWARQQLSVKPPAPSLADLIERRAALLCDYQDAAYAERFRTLVRRAQGATARARLGDGFVRAVAENFAKLMAYKDEYEVARLYSDGVFRASLQRDFDAPQKLSVWLAPPLFSPRDPRTGAPKKLRFGGWIFPVFEQLAKLKRLRGTRFDPFGWTAERREERRLVDEYESTIAALCDRLSEANEATATALASIPAEIRGFGHVKAKSLKLAQLRRQRLLAKMEVSSGPTQKSVAEPAASAR
jgi:indolepyruvate ferredoxin oxidoreductase